MKKQVLAGFLTMSLMFFLIGCESDSKQDQTTSLVKTTEASESAEDETTENTEAETSESTEAEISDELQLPTIEQTVIYDQDGLKVTAEKIEFDIMGDYSLYLTFENNTAETYELFNGNMLVEDVFLGTFGAIGSIECAPGETKTDYLTIDSNEIKEMGINTLGTMRFPLDFSHENYDLSIHTEYITLKTSDSGKFTPQLDDNGIEIINDAGYRVVGMGIVDGFSYKEYKFYVENNNATEAYISTESTTQNGAESEFYFSTEIPPNSRFNAFAYMSDESLAALVESDELTSLIADIIIEKEMFSNEIITKASGVELIK